MLELEQVSKWFGLTQALDAVTLSVVPCQTTVLIGPSGCGKSTLLRIMIGLIDPDGGTVQFEGTTISPEIINELRHKMGYVIQEGGLFPHLTAQANITVMARQLGWPEDRMRDRLANLVTLTRFPSDGLDRFPAQLSGGQRQRVSLMRALMLDPDLLLLDEPLGALDPMIRTELQDDLQSIFRELGKTVVLVTHDLAEADFLGDTILLMNEGVIVQQGTIQQMLGAPADPFVRRFIEAQRRPISSTDPIQ